MNNDDLMYVGISPWLEQNTCDLDKYLHLAQRCLYQTNEVIVASGTVVNKLYYLEKGFVKASMNNRDGSEKMLFMLDNQTIFAEVSYFSRTVTNTSFIALAESVVYQFDYDVVEEQLLHDSDVAKQLFQVMSRKTKALVNQLGDSVVNDPQYRLLKALYMLKNECGFPKSGAWIIPKKLTHQELADITGLHRVTISNLLTRLQKNHILKKEKEQIIIYNWQYVIDNVL